MPFPRLTFPALVLGALALTSCEPRVAPDSGLVGGPRATSSSRVSESSARGDASSEAAPPATGPAASSPLLPGLDPAEVCARAEVVAAPVADQPSAADRPALITCDAEALYYGIGATAPDYEKARKCAYAKDSTAILMMVYANGKGVPRNLDVATKFACDYAGAPAEIEGRIVHLRAIQGQSTFKKDFDYCDDITSGAMGGVCAAREERMAASARLARKRAAVAGLPTTEMRALDLAAAAFFDARTENEVDLSGTLRNALQIDERRKLEVSEIASLERIRDPAFPPRTNDFARTEAELNGVYGEIVAAKKVPAGTVTVEGIRVTERLWIPYREAWVALGRKVRPEVPAEVWRGWLSGERTKMLRELEGRAARPERRGAPR